MAETITIPFDPNGQELLLIHFSDNWADECDFSGFAVMTTQEFEVWKDKIPEKGVFDISFGTNEQNTYTKKDFLHKISVEHINENEAWVLRRLFPFQKHEGIYNANTNKYTFTKIIETARYGFFPTYFDRI